MKHHISRFRKQKGLILMPDKFYREIIESIPIGFAYLKVITDAAGEPYDYVIQDVNDALAQILHLRKESMLGVGIGPQLDQLAEHGTLVSETLKRVYRARVTETITIQFARIESWCKMTVVAGKKGYLILILSDITASMRPYFDLGAFFDFTPDLLSISQPDGRYLRVNPAWTTVLGYSAAEVEGHFSKEFLHPDDLAAQKTIKKQLETSDTVINFVNRYRHKDGNYRFLEWDARRNGDQVFSIARDITNRKEREDHITYLSYHDTLTGLFNRRFLEEEIRRLDVARNLPISVIMGDVNRLKLVNDAFGHEKGDELLIKSAEALQKSCRPEDLIARWGGDEFLIFLTKTSASDAGSIVERIHDNCAGAAVNSIPVSISFGIGTKVYADQSITDVMREAENAMYLAKSGESERSRSDIIKAIAETLYDQNPFEKLHAKRVSALCRKTAEAFGLSETEVERLSMAGLMHDIGKVAISMEILDKSTPLSEEEWSLIRKHSEIGYRVIGSAQDMVEIGNAVLAHHERLDGAGYPSGTAGSEIPLAARIIAVADSFDTMTSQEHYRKKLTMEEAVAELRKNEGSQFDPVITELFIRQVLGRDDL